MGVNQELPIREKANVDANKADLAEFGHRLRDEHFMIDPSFRNLNHGSFGTYPRVIQAKLREYQDLAEARPDPFIRYDQVRVLDESREAVARLLRAPVDTCVFVPNASVGVNTVLRNLVWNTDGRDEIFYFSTIYGGCAKTIDYMVEDRAGAVGARCIELSYPCEDEDIVAAFHAAVDKSVSEGRRPRICLFDVVSSLPGVRFPFEAITAACRERGLLSLVDGAQGIGMVDLDLPAVDPDFFVSNCHKWLHVPRGSAVFYVPLRNQPLIRSTLPTSHGFVPRAVAGGGNRFNPLPPSTKSEFVNNFEFVGSIDTSPYLCVKDAIRWREEYLGGEERIRNALTAMAREGGRRAAEILGTHVLDTPNQNLTRCAMVNVALPLAMEPDEGEELRDDLKGVPVIPKSETGAVLNWILRTLMDEYKTFVALFFHGGRYWMRLSAQVYLELEDFEWAGRTLKTVCERAAKGEYKA